MHASSVAALPAVFFMHHSLAASLATVFPAAVVGIVHSCTALISPPASSPSASSSTSAISSFSALSRLASISAISKQASLISLALLRQLPSSSSKLATLGLHHLSHCHQLLHRRSLSSVTATSSASSVHAHCHGFNSNSFVVLWFLQQQLLHAYRLLQLLPLHVHHLRLFQFPADVKLSSSLCLITLPPSLPSICSAASSSHCKSVPVTASSSRHLRRLQNQPPAQPLQPSLPLCFTFVHRRLNLVNHVQQLLNLSAVHASRPCSSACPS